jgi:actin-binding LIM protein
MLEYCDIRSEHGDLFAERRRRWSDTYKGVPDSDEEDEVDGKEKKNDLDKIEDTKLKVTKV